MSVEELLCLEVNDVIVLDRNVDDLLKLGVGTKARYLGEAGVSEQLSLTEGGITVNESETVEKSTNAGEAGDAKVKVDRTQFNPIAGGGTDAGNNPQNINVLMDLELPITVELGRVQMTVKDILDLGPGSVVELNKFSGEPVDIFVNNRKFAEGEVIVVDQNFAVRITALIGPDERLMNLK